MVPSCKNSMRGFPPTAMTMTLHSSSSSTTSATTKSLTRKRRTIAIAVQSAEETKETEGGETRQESVDRTPDREVLGNRDLLASLNNGSEIHVTVVANLHTSQSEFHFVDHRSTSDMFLQVAAHCRSTTVSKNSNHATNAAQVETIAMTATTTTTPVTKPNTRKRLRGRPPGSTRSIQNRPSIIATASTKTRVKYDMELVPFVKKSHEIWHAIIANLWPPKLVTLPYWPFLLVPPTNVEAISLHRSSALKKTHEDKRSCAVVKNENHEEVVNHEKVMTLSPTERERGTMILGDGPTVMTMDAFKEARLVNHPTAPIETLKNEEKDTEKEMETSLEMPNSQIRKSVEMTNIELEAAATSVSCETNPQSENSAANPETSVECASNGTVTAVVPPITTSTDFTPTQSSNLLSTSILNSSVLFIPKERQEWEDSVSEMVALCTSAAHRRYQTNVKQYGGENINPFYPPLSRDYIQDRVDVDDPMHGFQIRHATGGWLQGFVWWTNFTTWNDDFIWDSNHPASGLADTLPNCRLDDARGSLSKELQALPRHGNAHDQGIVFEHVAEIAILGGLGCGELLLRMALEQIRTSPDHDYQYVVLQATEGSRGFYEQFGFVRVGAVCRYESADVTAHIDTPTLAPFQGYRHWTHTNESQYSLDLHGGPSNMMCLKLPPNDYGVPTGNLLDLMSQLRIDSKPIVQSIGSINLPSRKSNPCKISPAKRSSKRIALDPTMLRPSLANPNATTSSDEVDHPRSVKAKTTNKRRPGRPRKRSLCETVPSKLLTSLPQPRVNKRRKVSDTENGISLMLTTNKSTKVPRTQPKEDKANLSSNQRNRIIRAQPKDLQSAGQVQLQARDYLQEYIIGAKMESKSPSPIVAVDKTKLCKQKVKSVPRDRDHYYNKVVVHKENVKADKTLLHLQNETVTHYFVLDYDEDSTPTPTLILIPVKCTGTLSGKRSGRPRFQCVVLEDTSNWKVQVPASDYCPVSATAVMKTANVALEAWDIGKSTV